MVRLLFLFCFLFGLTGIKGQCLSTPPAVPDCNDCEVANYGPNINVPANSTQCIPFNSSITVNNITIGNNGHLIICGKVTVNENVISINGVISISPTGAFTVNQNLILNSNSGIINYGTVGVNNQLILNSNSYLINQNSSASVIANQIISNSGSYIHNDGGHINADLLILNSNSVLCMANNGCATLENMIVNSNSTVLVSSGIGVINYTGNAILNNTLTNSQDLYVCKAPGATVSQPNNWGSANVVENCTDGCGPFAAVSLSAELEEKKTHLILTLHCSACPKDTKYIIRVIPEIDTQTVSLYTTYSNIIVINSPYHLNNTTFYIYIYALNASDATIAQTIIVYNANKNIIPLFDPATGITRFNRIVEVVELYNSLGMLLSIYKYVDNIDISNLENGIYLLVIRDNGINKVVKVYKI